MKPNLKILVLFVMAAIFALPAFAQHDGRANDCSESADNQEVNLKKRQFMQDSLSLTEAEATKFWAAFDANNKSERGIFKKYQEKMNAIAEPGTKMRELDDEKFVQMKEQKMQRRLELQKLENDYFAKLKKILPVEKLARYYRLEQAFRFTMVKEKNAKKAQPADNQQNSGEKPLQYKKRR